MLTIRIEPELLGLQLAHADDQSQATALNSFGANLSRVCGNRIKEEMQIYSIVQNLDKDGRALIEQIADFIAMDIKAKAKESEPRTSAIVGIV